MTLSNILIDLKTCGDAKYPHEWSKDSKDHSEHQDGSRYEASSLEQFDSCHPALPLPTSNLSFVDLGCGKGKALLLAHTKGYRAIRGVELIPQLAKMARRNVRACPNVSIVESDATKFTQYEDNTVVYLFNPFGLRTMRQVVDNIVASRARNIFVIYAVATYPGLFSERFDTLYSHNLRESSRGYKAILYHLKNRT